MPSHLQIYGFGPSPSPVKIIRSAVFTASLLLEEAKYPILTNVTKLIAINAVNFPLMVAKFITEYPYPLDF